MKNRDLVLTIIFLLLVAVSVGATYYRYIIKQDVPYETDEELFQLSLLEE